MNRTLISRVILLSDGTVHIATQDRQTIACTPTRLKQLLADPLHFLVVTRVDVQTTSTINVTNSFGGEHGTFPLEKIPGLTLISIYSDAEIVCTFPKLLHYLFNSEKLASKDSASEDSASEESLNLKEIANDMDFSDEKHFLLNFFFKFTEEKQYNKKDQRRQTIMHAIDIEPEKEMEILRETFNTAFLPLDAIAKKQEEVNAKAPENSSITSALLTEDPVVKMIPIKEWAKKHRRDKQMATEYARKNRIPGAEKIKGAWCVPANAPWPKDGRSNPNKTGSNQAPELPTLSTVSKKSKSKSKSKPKGKNSSMTKQEYLVYNKVASDAICKFVYSLEEAKHYCENGYREIEIDGKRHLIIDVHPDYTASKSEKNPNPKSNRELMKGGKPPKCPTDNDEPYHLHHIGQKNNSPFAVLPHKIHSEYSRSFHHGKTKSINEGSEIDRDEFTDQKEEFWMRYIEMYDAAGSYENIPYFNKEMNKEPVDTLPEANKKNSKKGKK